jgi:serine/threonine-protein kinase HipA
MAFPDLAVWMNGLRVGVWFWTRTGTPGFRYDDAWVASPQARPLSLSLPIPAGGGDVTGPKVENFFDNLLPESNRVRERIRRRFNVASNSAADMLAAIGRDCVGAVQILRDGDEPAAYDRIESRALTESEVARLIADVPADGPQDDPLLADFRISIAGVQEKTALLRIGDSWHLPHGSTPTTHILKLPLGLLWSMRADMSTSVENEWLCLAILRELGLPVAHADIAQFGAHKVLVVERFDRRWMDDGKWIARLPQEDLCQATGTPAEKKYENEGGPGIRACLGVLSAGSNAQQDQLTFALAQLAFWLLAATDGHAKNFSIFHERGGGYRMTPLYDVLSIWPIIGDGANQISFRRAKLAMALRSKNAHYALNEIRVRHWQALAAQTGVPDAFDRMVAMVLMAPEAMDRVGAELPAGFPKQIFSAIRRGVVAQAERFVAEL